VNASAGKQHRDRNRRAQRNWLLRLCLASLTVSGLTGCVMPSSSSLGRQIETDRSLNSVERMVHGLALRFADARDRGGMFGVSADIQTCYAQAVRPAQVRDCLVLDAVARRIDMTTAKALPGGSLPYWTETAVTHRWARYNRSANFPDIQTQLEYMAHGSEAVLLDLAKHHL